MHKRFLSLSRVIAIGVVLCGITWVILKYFPKQVALSDLIIAPDPYLNQLVDVQGFNAGGIPRRLCASWTGPPTQWILGTNDPGTAAAGQRHIQVQNFAQATQLRADKSGNVLQNPYGKRMRVWGWIRLYQGPVGCGTESPQRRIWYIEALRVEFLESIEVKPSGN